MKNDWITYLGVALVLGAGGYAAWTFWPRAGEATSDKEPDQTGEITPVTKPTAKTDAMYGQITLPDGRVIQADPDYVGDPSAGSGSNPRITPAPTSEGTVV